MNFWVQKDGVREFIPEKVGQTYSYTVFLFNFSLNMRKDMYTYQRQYDKICTPYGSVFGKRDLLAIFHVMKYDVKCARGTCLDKFDCSETTLSNAANHLKIFLIEFEICLYKHVLLVH